MAPSGLYGRGLARGEPVGVEAGVAVAVAQNDDCPGRAALDPSQVPQELDAELLLDEPDLGGPLVFGGEAELEELIAHELLGGPPVGVHVAGVAGLHARHGACHTRTPGRIQTHRAEGPRLLDPEIPPLPARVRPPRELRVRSVDVEQVLALGVEDECAHALPLRAASEQLHALVRLQELIEQKQRVRRLGRDPGDPGNGEVPPGASVDEAHVGVDGIASQIEPDREPAPLHLVLEEGDPAVLADRAQRLRARVGGHEELRDDPQHAHLGHAHMLGGHRAIHHAGRVGGQVRPLEAAPQLGDDPVVGDARPVRQLGAHGGQLVQLDGGARIEHHAELARVASRRAVDEPDPGARRGPPTAMVAHAAPSSRLRCMTASRTARSASRGSPSRW